MTSNTTPAKSTRWSKRNSAWPENRDKTLSSSLPKRFVVCPKLASLRAKHTAVKSQNAGFTLKTCQCFPSRLCRRWNWNLLSYPTIGRNVSPLLQTVTEPSFLRPLSKANKMADKRNALAASLIFFIPRSAWGLFSVSRFSVSLPTSMLPCKIRIFSRSSPSSS